MTINKPFEHGVLGVLHGTWEIELLSPLAIRNGDKIAFKQKEKRLAKGRGTNLALAWSQSETVLANQPDEYSKIADCNYHFALHHGQVHVEYSIPASSIRGALRNTAIKRWVEWSNRKTFSLPNTRRRRQAARGRPLRVGARDRRAVRADRRGAGRRARPGCRR